MQTVKDLLCEDIIIDIREIPYKKYKYLLYVNKYPLIFETTESLCFTNTIDFAIEKIDNFLHIIENDEQSESEIYIDLTQKPEYLGAYIVSDKPVKIINQKYYRYVEQLLKNKNIIVYSGGFNENGYGFFVSDTNYRNYQFLYASHNSSLSTIKTDNIDTLLDGGSHYATTIDKQNNKITKIYELKYKSESVNLKIFDIAANVFYLGDIGSLGKYFSLKNLL